MLILLSKVSESGAQKSPKVEQERLRKWSKKVSESGAQKSPKVEHKSLRKWSKKDSESGARKSPKVEHESLRKWSTKVSESGARKSPKVEHEKAKQSCHGCRAIVVVWLQLICAATSIKSSPCFRRVAVVLLLPWRRRAIRLGFHKPNKVAIVVM
ncbi:hypothetical protein LWI29_036666 [Acer saccharum]|uniref:Uncharacterized protein n=1 Tax=Acer saccharum TaxID=4024 RepID=A0AA39VUT7_ACESA|nr:hypothetical protein LWI29_036666 [Acer saccharum]